MLNAACISDAPIVARVGDSVSCVYRRTCQRLWSCHGSAFFRFAPKYTERDGAFAVDVHSAKGSECNGRKKERTNGGRTEGIIVDAEKEREKERVTANERESGRANARAVLCLTRDQHGCRAVSHAGPTAVGTRDVAQHT